MLTAPPKFNRTYSLERDRQRNVAEMAPETNLLQHRSLFVWASRGTDKNICLAGRGRVHNTPHTNKSPNQEVDPPLLQYFLVSSDL